MRRIVTGFLIMGVLAGCGGTPTKEQEGARVEDRIPSPVAAAPETQPKPADPGAAAKRLDPSRVAADPLKDPGSILSKRSIYFDFDSTIVKDEYKPIVAAHAKYVSQNRSTRIRIEGNADERGSREYNLALGQRRADAVKQMMQLLGASPSQVETVSFGEEKPKAPGHDEASWAENRRADIRYGAE